MASVGMRSPFTQTRSSSPTIRCIVVIAELFCPPLQLGRPDARTSIARRAALCFIIADARSS